MVNQRAACHRFVFLRMQPLPGFSLRARLKSFGYAFRGLRLLFRTEHNAYLHLMAAAVAVGLGMVVKLDRYEWLWMVVAIVLVFAAELFNTAIEKLCDVVHPDYSEKIKVIKDLAAGAVLVCAVGAVVIGLFVFINHLL